MMKCQRCESERILNVNAKTSDRLSLWMVNGNNGNEHYGYNDLGVDCIQDDDGCNDYLLILLCLDCGQVQGEFPQKTIANLED